MNPLISVVVPVYKVEQYLDKCVRSLLAQSYPALEIMLVDDGSPDHCGELCDGYAQAHGSVVALHKPNGGLGDARNYAVQRANGEYITFVDSDDFVEKNYVSDLWNLIDRFSADMAITRMIREPEGSTVIKKNDKFPSFAASQEDALFEICCASKVGWSACAKLFKKELIAAHPFPKGYYEDCAVMYQIIADCKTPIAIGDFEGNYHYVERNGSILKSKLDERHMHVFDICQEFEAYAKRVYPTQKILPVIFWRRCVTQFLNLQSMDNKTYNSVFCRYRPYFRKNLLLILKEKRLSNKIKIHSILLCTTPGLYRLQNKIVSKTKR